MQGFTRLQNFCMKNPRLKEGLNPVILLQIVIVSPGTHLVKNQSQSPSPEPWSPSSNTQVPGSLCNHTVNLKGGL